MTKIKTKGTNEETLKEMGRIMYEDSPHYKLGRLIAENVDLKIRLEKSEQELKETQEKLTTTNEELNDARNYIRNCLHIFPKKWGGE